MKVKYLIAAGFLDCYPNQSRYSLPTTIMEPLGAVASILTVLGAASSISQSLGSLITLLRGIPDAILALNNEVSDLQLILGEISGSIGDKEQSDPAVH